MYVKNDALLEMQSNIFLEELRLLRGQNKGKYISEFFCVQLEKLSNKIEEAIQQQNYENKILKLSRSQLPEKMSDNSVELCLECIEIYLQKISGCDILSELKTDFVEEVEKKNTQVNPELQVLTHIACDLRALAMYIKFTLYPDELKYKCVGSKSVIFH